jgi:predicted nucleic acid-binding protein
MTADLAAFRPAEAGPTALFLDKSALFAYFHPGTAEHDRIETFFDRVGRNEIPYRPLYTSTYVVDELVTLLLSKGTTEYATAAMSRTLDSESVEVIEESRAEFEATRDRIERYDDRNVSFTDQLSAVQMRERNVSHVLAFDGDFGTLGFEQVPRD